jgi:hypothetical protein
MKTFGQNNFNYLRDEWARNILKDASAAHRESDEVDITDCTLTGESSAVIIERIFNSYFGVHRDLEFEID